jgi:hypothetical protein
MLVATIFLFSHSGKVTTQSHLDIKRIGDTGQVSVGKSLAGKLVRVEPVTDGVMLRFVVDVPEKDAWWTREPHKSALQDALAWAAMQSAAETNLDGLLKKVRSAKKASRASRKKAPMKKT